MNQFLASPKVRSRHWAAWQRQERPACNRSELDDENLGVARLIGAWPAECTDAAIDTGRMLRLLMQALRRERALGRAGRHAYNLTRHIDLARACHQARLAAKQKSARPDSGRALKIHAEIFTPK